jgi:Zn finger protein HypA/HybF involved in hydrogenase expression
MATKIPVAQKRMFHNVFVCKDCRKKVRTQAVRVVARKVRCPRCGSHAFRQIKKK